MHRLQKQLDRERERQCEVRRAIGSHLSESASSLVRPTSVPLAPPPPPSPPPQLPFTKSAPPSETSRGSERSSYSKSSSGGGGGAPSRSYSHPAKTKAATAATVAYERRATHAARPTPPETYRHEAIRKQYGDPADLERWLTRVYSNETGLVNCVLNRVRIESRYGKAVEDKIDVALAAYSAHRLMPEARACDDERHRHSVVEQKR